MYDVYRFLIAALFTWRVTHFLQSEDGPWDVGMRLRRAAGDGRIGHLLDCFYCLSIWIGLSAALLISSDVINFVLVWPALSGAAILLERSTAGERHRSEFPQAKFEEDEREE
jgi:hypothetical protein